MRHMLHDTLITITSTATHTLPPSISDCGAKPFPNQLQEEDIHIGVSDGVPS